MSPNVLPFPVHIVSAGNIRDQLIAAGRGNRWASIPAFAKTVTPAGSEVPILEEDDDGELVEVATRRTSSQTVSIGMIRRQCTTDFKIVPIRRKIRELAGLTRKRSPSFPVVESWIGISTDEIIRAKPSFEGWQIKRFPLIEQRMSRRDCLAWLRRYDYPDPPKSACIGCPTMTMHGGGICARLTPKLGQTRRGLSASVLRSARGCRSIESGRSWPARPMAK